MLALKFVMGFGFGFLLALLTEHDDPAENMGIHAMIYGILLNTNPFLPLHSSQRQG